MDKNQSFHEPLFEMFEHKLFLLCKVVKQASEMRKILDEAPVRSNVRHTATTTDRAKLL